MSDYYMENSQELENFIQSEVGSNVNSLIDLNEDPDLYYQFFDHVPSDELDAGMPEIFEFWTVSSFLYNKLQDLGEPVYDAGSCFVWGRTTTGQSMAMDYPIVKIHQNLNEEVEV